MIVSISIDEKIAGEIDDFARDQNMSRSRWVEAACREKLGQRQAALGKLAKRIPGEQKLEIRCRIPASDRARVDAVAEQLHMTRSQWIATRIRGGVSSAAEAVLPSQKAHMEASEAIAQVVRIGLNVNQAVRALNASLMVGSSLDTQRIADQIIAMKDDIWQVIDEAEKHLLAIAGGEQAYWRGNHEK